MTTRLTAQTTKVFDLEERVRYFERLVRVLVEGKTELLDATKKALSALVNGSDEEAREILELAIKKDVENESKLTTLGESEE